MRIFDEKKIPENPHKPNESDSEWAREFKRDKERYYSEGQQSILSIAQDVELDDIFLRSHIVDKINTFPGHPVFAANAIIKLIEQFIKSQEGKKNVQG